MPLMSSALTLSPGLPGAGGRAYPASRQAAAAEWADAVEAWISGITPPSTTIHVARTSLEIALASAFGTHNAGPAMDAAFQSFGTLVAAGMLPSFAAVPPPAPVGFASALFAEKPATRQAGVDLIASALQSWALSGLATLVAPPNTVVPWA